MSNGSGPWPTPEAVTRGPADVELELTVRLGTASLTLRELAELGHGAIVELDRFVDDPVDLLLEGQLVARGEIEMEDDGPVVVITDVLQ